MEKNLYFRWFLDFASIYPAAVLCFAPVLKLMKKPIRTLLICFIGITFVCLGSAALCMRFSLSSNGLLLPITNLSFVLYFILLRKQISLPKAAFLFLMATLLTAVSVLLSFIFNARRETENPAIVCLASTSAIALTVEMIICIVYSVFFSKYIRWLILELDSKSVWRSVWMIPAVFTIFYIFVMPIDPSTVLINRLPKISVLAVLASLSLYFMFMYLFYRIAKECKINIALINENQLLAYEAKRYEELQERMEKTRRQRHDFRQHLRVISGLTASGKLEELKKYLAQYDMQLEDEGMPICANAAMDAIIGYYRMELQGSDINAHWRIELPEKLPLSESDLCVVMGNLLENAVRCVRSEKAGNRSITVYCRMVTPAILGIVIENTYDGKLDCRNGVFYSTSHDGRGTGLLSVETIAKKYNGDFKVETENGVFRANVLLNV